MTIKESEIIWTFIGQMKGFLLILNNLSKCINNDLFKNVFNDMRTKINNVENNLKNLRNE